MTSKKRRRQEPKDYRDLRGMRAFAFLRVSKVRRDGDDSGGYDEKSVDDQEYDYHQFEEQTGVKTIGIFKDPGFSASRFRAKDPPDLQRMLDEVPTAKPDLVWFFQVDRSNRDWGLYVKIRDVFVPHQVALYTNGRLYHTDNDWWMLGIESGFAQRESDDKSPKIIRGHTSNAREGIPHGPVAFGYRRQRHPNEPQGVPKKYLWFNSRQQLWMWQEWDVSDGDGGAVEDSPAWVVREIYRRIAGGESMVAIANDLTDRRIPHPVASGGFKTGPKLYPWNSGQIRQIAQKPVYIAKRVHLVEDYTDPVKWADAIMTDVQAKWPPLVDEDLFWQVHRIIADPARKRTRPYAAQSMLSSIVSCAKCGSRISATSSRNDPVPSARRYQCNIRACAAIPREDLDAFVDKVMIRWLSRRDVFEALTAADDSPAAAAARGEADQYRAKLAQYRAIDPMSIDAVTLANATTALLARIDEAERRARATSTAIILDGYDSPEMAETAWANAETTRPDGTVDYTVKRRLLAAVADISLKPAGRDRPGWNGKVTMADVARRVGCSQSVASLVMNDKAGTHASPATAEAIRAAARDLGYVKRPYSRPSSIRQRLNWRWLTGPDAGQPLDGTPREE